MRHFILYLFVLFCLISCKSVADEVKENKAKFLQVAKESTTPVELTNVEDAYNQAKLYNIEAKINYLGINAIETSFASKNTKVNLDSVVVFTKAGYKIFYDFRMNARSVADIEKECKLNNFEALDNRLYIGN